MNGYDYSINDLLYDYQNNDKDASLFIINTYVDFIGEYFDLMTESNYTPTENTLSFLELFGEETVEKSLQDLKILISSYEPDEIYNELISILLILAKRCDPDNDFEIYLKVCFKYELYNRLLENNPDFQQTYVPPDLEVIFGNEEIDNFKDNKKLSSLTILQRIILKLIYIEELSVYYISEMLHIEEDELTEEINNAIDILKNI